MTVTAIVSGATGFAGKNLCKELVDAGWNVHAIIREHSDTTELIKCAGNQVSVHRCDESATAIADIVKTVKPNIAFHLAAMSTASDAVNIIPSMISSNITLGTILAKCLIDNDCYNFVNVGSFWQHYDGENTYNPSCLYAATKEAMQDILQYYANAYGMRVITLKLFDTYGENDARKKILYLLKENLCSGEQLDMSPGKQEMNLIHIKDVAQCMRMAGEYLLDGKITLCSEFAVRGEDTICLKDLAEKIEQISGKHLNINWGGRPYRPREIMKPWSSGNVLPGWSPKITLDEGLAGYLKE